MINENLLAYPTSTPFTPEYKFNTVEWTGNATARKIVGVGFQPDLIWIKDVHESSNDNSFRFFGLNIIFAGPPKLNHEYLERFSSNKI